MVFFSYKNDVTFLCKDDFSRKYISNIIEKDNIYPRKHGICSDRNIKDDKKGYSVKYTHEEPA